jgi:hypothetical protein
MRLIVKLVSLKMYAVIEKQQTPFEEVGLAVLAADESNFYCVPPRKKDDCGDSFVWTEDVLKRPHFSAASVYQMEHVIIIIIIIWLLQRTCREMHWTFLIAGFYYTGTFGWDLGLRNGRDEVGG